MADYLSAVPSIGDVLGAAQPSSAPPTAGPPPDTGTGFFGSALGAGYHDLLGQVSSFAQTVGQATGADRLLPGFVQSQADEAQRQRALAASYANPAYDSGGWDPASLAYGFLRGLPSFAPTAIGAGAAGALTGGLAPAAEGAGFLARMFAPRALATIAGGALGAFPGQVGENMQRAEDEGQPTDQNTALKALGLGVPEAALQGIFPGAVENILEHGAVKAFAGRGAVANALAGAGALAGVQATTGAATEALMQQMGDPNRSFAERSQQILNAALSGGIQGAVFGGITHLIAKTPPEKIGDQNLSNVVDQTLGLPPPNPPDTPLLPPPQRFNQGPPEYPGQRPPSGATILAPDEHVYDGTEPGPIPPTPPNNLLPPPVLEGARPPGDGQAINVPPTGDNQISRPALPPPPIIAPDDTLETMKSKLNDLSNKDLIDHANMHPGEKSAQAAMELLKDRLKGTDVSSPQTIKDTLNQQDVTKANTDRIKNVAKVVPDYLKQHLGDEQQLKNAIFQEATRRDQDGTPLGKRLTAIAQEFKILSDDGKLVDPRPEAPPQDVPGPVDQDATKPTEGTTNIGPEPEDTTGNPPPTPPPTPVPEKPNPPPSPGIEAIPDRHRAKWQALDDIEKSLPANLPPELADTPQKIADMKSKLAAPKRGEVGQVVSFTNKLREKLKALDTIREGQPTENTPPAPTPPQDPTKGASKFDTPDEPPPAPPNQIPPPVDRPFDNPPVHPQPQPESSIYDRYVKKYLESNADRAAQFGASPEAQAAAAKFEQERSSRNNQINLGKAKADAIDNSFGRPTPKPIGEELPQPKRPMNDRASNIDVTDNSKVQKLEDDAGQVDPLTQIPASRPVTQGERDLAYLIDRGATPRQLLQFIVRNGSNSLRRTIAARLLQFSKAEPTIRWGSRAEANKDHGPLVHVYGDYHDKLGRIRIYDAADMEHTIIHEFTHAATLRAIRAGGEAAKKLKALYDHALTQLTPDERRQYGFKNVAEMVAEAFSNNHFAHFLDGLSVPKDMLGDVPKTTVWRAFKEIVRRMFGFPVGAETMLDHVTHLAGQLMDETDRSWPAGSAPDLNQTTSLYARNAQDFGEKVLNYVDTHADPMSWPTKLFKMVAGWRDLAGLADAMRQHVPAMMDKVRVATSRKVYGEHIAQMVVQAINSRRVLPPEVQKLLSQVMTFTINNIDPRRGWDQHTWLHNATNAAELKAEVIKANQLYNELKRKGGAKAYADAHNVNDMLQSAQITAELRNAMRNNPKINLPPDPFETFRFNNGLRANTRVAADHFYQAMKDHVNLARGHMAAVQNAMKTETDPVLKAQQRASIQTLRSIEQHAAAAMTSRTQGPNFAIRRQGNYFVSGALKNNFTAAQVARVQSYLQSKGFNDLVFQHNTENNNFYMRVNSMSEATKLHMAMADLQKEGTIGDKAIASGSASVIHQNAGALPRWVQQKIADLKNSLPDLPEGTDAATIQKYNAARESAINQLTAQYLDMLPDSAVSKLFAARQGVQGFNANMLRAFDERGMNAARGIGTTATSVDIGRTNSDMLAQLRKLKQSPLDRVSMPERVRAQVAVNEAFMREANHGFNAGHSPIDAVRHFTHFFELGFSIPYAVTLASQLPTLGWGELAKTHGFAASSAAMIRAMPMAIKIMKAAATGDNRTGFMLTPEKLAKAGIPKDIADAILHQDNRGDFNLSSYTSNIYDGLHHDGIMRTIHDVTGATTLYSEMAPRLVVALAAKDLFDQRPMLNLKDGVIDRATFISDKVQRSQFQWNTDLNPRNTGKNGPFGQLGPLFTQFMGYHLKLMEKLYREAADSVGARGDTEKKQARTFLMYHVAAMTALSGTMGLPMTGLFAGLYDKLADLVTGDHTHDIKADYRNFLATMFGKDVGEVIARGLPRVAGIDLSHLGEDNIVPGTSLMSDKRSWSDAEGDFLKSLAGSAVGLGSNLVVGGRDFLNGDVLEGFQKVLPEMLRNAVEAGELSTRGYRDKNGFNLPIKATTADAVKKLLGFTPEQEAEYKEENQVSMGLEERSQYDKANIMSHMAKAFNLQDPSGYETWLRASEEYQQSHPGEMPPAMGFADFMREHARSAALAGALGTPVNIGQRDLLRRGATQFGNIQNQ